MREFTSIERERLERGECPVCGQVQPRWNNGPLGGASRNLEMSCCGARINVIDPDRYGWPPPALMGQVIDEALRPAQTH